MLPDERRRQILALLNSSEVLRPADMAVQLDVSPETIRRDLVLLEREGAIRRVYGGAAKAKNLSRSAEPGRVERENIEREAKAEIAEVVASIVGDDDTVFLDVGTTVLAAARALPESFRGRVVTNNLGAVLAMAGRDGVNLHLVGGRVRHDELTCSGPDAEDQVSNFFADKAFLGSGGVHATGGLTDYHLDEIAVRRRMISNAAEVYVLADGSKLGHVALRKVCELDRITALITDSSADPEMVAQLRDAGLTVVQPAVAGAEDAAS
ncbi:DeoR/GlpR family DNA-binding transcription regulator [Amycolatopsis sp. DSM 110486]|uniref:DeoR/GlpR family DNA-binding transcription regulator n=1 Tax=Amycolatopsis sp. DSM 110486 TaxID=2865832 RepID=UPI001C69ECED|nr:DeoR/GlpR family DNA-binding transcription regulator [Amycolatopsis sp. DSM 110486]QYN18707.1 DeoR/GlpR family DNA-binding transcription regulator [Amycolatopsis sp. DSM 110486]